MALEDLILFGPREWPFRDFDFDDQHHQFIAVSKKVKKYVLDHPDLVKPSNWEMPHGVTGSGDQSSARLSSAKRVWTALLPLLQAMQLGSSPTGVVPLPLFFDAVYASAVEAFKVLVDLHLAAQFHHQAGKLPLSKPFMDQILKAPLTLEEKRELVRVEIARLTTQKAAADQASSTLALASAMQRISRPANNNKPTATAPYKGTRPADGGPSGKFKASTSKGTPPASSATEGAKTS